jgi:hypothetical protein
MPQIPSLAGFNNAQLLKQSPSSANMANYDDIFAGPAEGHVPTAWEQFSGDRNADAAETAMGAGPAIDALRHAMDDQRLQQSANVRAKLDDNQMVEDDFNANGLNRGMAHANVQNQVGDVLSEGKARRGFLPWAQQESEQNMNDVLATSDARYGEPARARAFGDMQTAKITGDSRVEAARVAHAPISDPIEAFKAALLKRFEAGYPITKEDIAQLQTALPH